MDIVGVWDVNVIPKIGKRTRSASLTIRDEDGTLVGHLNSKTGKEQIRNVVANGNDVQFEVARKLKDKEITFLYALTIDGDEISGATKLGTFEAATVSGTRRLSSDTGEIVSALDGQRYGQRSRAIIDSVATPVFAASEGSAPIDINRAMIFVISPPRSGSTLTTRMLGSHPEIFSTPELHLLPPLYHLGFYNPAWKEQPGALEESENVGDGEDENYRSYNKKFASFGIKSVVEWLPNFEEDYLEALRAYTNTIYSKLLAKSGRGMLLDKTPQYCRYADFIAKLYPSAHYIALTRNPIQTGLSIRKGMRDMKARETKGGKLGRARTENAAPIDEAALSAAALQNLKHYFKGMLNFLGERKINFYRLKYEDLVLKPEDECGKICDYLGIPYSPAMMQYDPKGYAMPGIVGDPYTVSKHTKPDPSLLKKFAINSEADMDFACAILELLDPAEFELLGYDPGSLMRDLERCEATL